MTPIKKKYTEYFSKLHKKWKPLLSGDNVQLLKKYKYKLK